MIGYLRKCPNCGQWHEGEPYDIGSGPEFCCRLCDWCWGALGQPLEQLVVEHRIGDDGRLHVDIVDPQTS